MRHLPSILALLATACSIEAIQRPPPSDRFVHPVSVVYRSAPGSSQGVLYVASANFERCYDQGSVIAVDLDQVTGADETRLPPLGTPGSGSGSGTPQFTNLNVAAGSQSLIQSFAGDMALWEPTSDRAPRLFVTTRSDASLLNFIDLPQPLRLEPAQSVSLENVQGALNGQPRAPSPMGLAVTGSGDLWMTHLEPADSPANSRQNFQSYAVRLDAESPQLSSDQFFPLAPFNSGLALGGAQGVAIGERYVFIGGRFLAGITADVSTGDPRRFLVRLLDRRQPRRLQALIDPGLEYTYSALDVRGLALDENAGEGKGRLYVVARQPDTLLVVDVKDSTSYRPKLSVVAAVPLPDGPSQVALVRRARGSPLVAVSCSTAGAVVLYDPDVGQIVAQVGEVGLQPHGLAVQSVNTLTAARLFVTNFSDGRVAVIDIRDLSRPQEARLVAHLGARQDGERTAGGCQEVPQ